MCEEASKTWAEVQDEIDCAVGSQGDCAIYRDCERKVQRQRLIDEAMRQRSADTWNPSAAWCSIFDKHRDTHPELQELCPKVSKAVKGLEKTGIPAPTPAKKD